MLPVIAAIVLNSPLADLQANFKNPPASAAPHTWWHWMAGNVTKEGITLDLEAMKEAGIGGAHIFDAGQGIPPGPIQYNSPEWQDLMAFAFSEAKRLGLDMTMHNCSGWSSSGGPWVKPEDAMKKVVWTRNEVTGGGDSVQVETPESKQDFYRDIALVAFPTPPGIPPKSDPNRSRLTGMGPSPADLHGLNWPKMDPSKRVDIPLDKLSQDGVVHYKLPAGNWTVLRIGYTLTGAHNVASRPSGEGLEVDKLSAKALDHFLDGGLEPLFKRIGPLKDSSLHTILIDSYETGYDNWTPGILAEFKKRRGYDPNPFLPALAGFYVGNEDRTMRFLFDWRRTIAELWAQNYSGHFADRLKQKGLKLAVEPYGNGNFDPFTYAKPAGLIMGEYWVGEGTINDSVKHASSVAHVYGHNVVGAEALTASPGQAGWRNQPRQWKSFADRGYALGINRIIYHRFAHQPWPKDVVPGMTMGPWGSHVDRTETFWSYMKPWDTYLARCQYMLQSGVFAGDILLFPGEDAPQSYSGEGSKLPEMPAGYDFDFCGLDPLKSVTVKSNRLTLPNGGSYRVLVLPETTKMTVGLANKIKSLVAAGATVLGPKPTSTPSLSESDAELRKIAAQVWGKAPGSMGSHPFGRGKVYWGIPVVSVLSKLGVTKDFQPGAKGVRAIHRRIGNLNSYFVASDQGFPRTVDCEFRAKGQPEFWNPETGEMSPVTVWKTTPTGTQVSIPFEADGSVFVIFGDSAASGADHVVRVDADLSGPDAKPLPELHILKAEYGDLDNPGKFIDVTNLLRKSADKHSLQISASNSDMGGDPAYNIVKNLCVTYELDGEEKTVTIPENGLLAIGAIRDAGSPPAYEVTQNGMRIWSNGSYKVSWSSGHQRTYNDGSLDPTEVPGSWEIRFPAGWDAPEIVTLDSLASWTENPDFGVQHFSGTATYVKRLTIDPAMFGPGRRLMLDFGDVREFARVRLNGKLVGTFWKPPFRVDITDDAHPGDNILQVEVTNLWVNRLIGDEQFPDDMGWDGDHLKGWPEWFVKGEPRPEPRRKTFTTWRHNFKDTPLLPSGILGPVTLRPVKVIRFP